MRRRSLSLIAFLIALGFSSCATNAMFMMPDIKKVPIERLFTNLQQRLVRDTNDFRTTYYLARLHAMAYATNLTEVDVEKKSDEPQFAFPFDDSGVPFRRLKHAPTTNNLAGFKHLTNAIALYERATRLLKKSTNEDDQWLVLPLELGHAWCLEQAGRRDDALKAYRRTLNIAWEREVTGEFSLKKWAGGVWDDVRALKNPLHSGRRRSIGPGVCFSEETIGYLLKLLNPVKDAKEIAELNERKNTLQQMGRAITPILVPLKPNVPLEQLVDARAAVNFDLDGSGRSRRWGWITSDAAWLVFDPEGTGRITSGLQIFGNVTFWIFWRDGYDALSSLDENDDGTLSGTELRGLALWQDLNADGISEPGEVQPVRAYGITSIACTPEDHSTGIPWNRLGVTFMDGDTRPTYDWIVPARP